MNENLLIGKRILIVDDEIDVLETLEEFLENNHVTKATSFDQALSFLGSESFDIAILDIMGVDGFRLLDIANEKKILSVMLTAHSLTPDITVKAYKRGAAYFVPKDRMLDIRIFLNDVLKSAQKGENIWKTWLQHLDDYYNERFGKNWKDDEREFWQAIASQNWSLAAIFRQDDDDD
jgi:DNA-binding NtrC family response regulator